MTNQETVTAHVQHASDAYQEARGTARDFSLRLAYEDTLCAEANTDLAQECPALWDVVCAALDTVNWAAVARDAGL